MLVDALYRLIYRVGYQGARVVWRLTKPPNRGALVTIWYGGRVLLIRNSYVKYFGLPGGNVRRNETALQAAVRELREEVGLDVEQEQLSLALDHEHIWEGRSDHVTIFRLEVEHAPLIRVDNREVVSASWFSPQEALRQDLFPPIRLLMEQELART